MYVKPNTSIVLMWDVVCDSDYNDTYYFDSTNEQEKFFLKDKKVFELEDYQYIRISSGTIRVDIPKHYVERCNYMAIKNSGINQQGNEVYEMSSSHPRWFYCFIKSCEYLNEGVTLINFELDVIQTYLFDFTFRQCIVERQHAITDYIGDNLYDEGLASGDYVTRKIHYNEEWSDLVPVVQCLITCDGVEKISFSSATASSANLLSLDEDYTIDVNYEDQTDNPSGTGETTGDLPETEKLPETEVDETENENDEDYGIMPLEADAGDIPDTWISGNYLKWNKPTQNDFESWFFQKGVLVYYFLKYSYNGRNVAASHYYAYKTYGTVQSESVLYQGQTVYYWFYPQKKKLLNLLTSAIWSSYASWWDICKGYYRKYYPSNAEEIAQLDWQYETTSGVACQSPKAGYNALKQQTTTPSTSTDTGTSSDNSYEYTVQSPFQTTSKQIMTNNSYINGVETGCVHWCFPQAGSKGNKASSKLTLSAFMCNASEGGVDSGVIAAYLVPSAFLHNDGSNGFYNNCKIDSGSSLPYYYTGGRTTPVVTNIYTDLTLMYQLREQTGYAPKNNKLFTYPYCALTLTGGAGGSTNMYRYEWFKDQNGVKVYPYSFNEYCTFVNGVKGVAAPCNYNGERINMAMASEISDFPVPALIVDSYKSYLAQTQYSRSNSLTQAGIDLQFGIETNALQTSYALSKNSYEYTKTMATSGASALANALTGNFGGSVNNLINMGTATGDKYYADTKTNLDSQITQRTLQKNYEKAVNSINAGIKDKSIMPMSVLSGAGTTAFNMVKTPDNNVPYNCFTYRDRSITVERAKQIDDYFTRYGYAYNVVMMPNKKTRSRFTFIKTVDCNVSGSIPEGVKSIINAVHDSGITYWADTQYTRDYEQYNYPLGGGD